MAYPNTSSLNDFWYFVGLMATDGCLINDGRHINITSAEKEYLQIVKERFALKTKVGLKYNGGGQIGYQLQISNAKLWRSLIKIGLTPKKSLTLGPIDVPDLFFQDFVRGVIDGDGNIQRWIHPQNGHEQWGLRIYSAAPLFVDWLYQRISAHFGVIGCTIINPRVLPHHTMYRLKFGKMAAQKILASCYYPGALALPRKEILADLCIKSYRGWSRSLTVSIN